MSNNAKTIENRFSELSKLLESEKSLKFIKFKLDLIHRINNFKQIISETFSLIIFILI